MISHAECYKILTIKRTIRNLQDLNIHVPDELRDLLTSRGQKNVHTKLTRSRNNGNRKTEL